MNFLRDNWKDIMGNKQHLLNNKKKSYEHYQMS